MCLTRGLTAAESPDPRAATEWLVVLPLAVVSERDSVGVGFCGMAGWTPSMASQWAVKSISPPAQLYSVPLRWGSGAEKEAMGALWPSYSYIPVIETSLGTFGN